MQFQIALLALATLAIATPAPHVAGAVELCSSNYSPMCCETDVLGVADLGCTLGAYNLYPPSSCQQHMFHSSHQQGDMC